MGLPRCPKLPRYDPMGGALICNLQGVGPFLGPFFLLLGGALVLLTLRAHPFFFVLGQQPLSPIWGGPSLQLPRDTFPLLTPTLLLFFAHFFVIIISFSPIILRGLPPSPLSPLTGNISLFQHYPQLAY